jgi:hypothetical protein
MAEDKPKILKAAIIHLEVPDSEKLMNYLEKNYKDLSIPEGTNTLTLHCACRGDCMMRFRCPALTAKS